MTGARIAGWGSHRIRSPRPASIAKRRGSLAAVAFFAMLVLASCASSDETNETGETTSTVGTTGSAVIGCADVVAVEIDQTGDTYRLSATILSADTGWEKYADAWEVRAPDGTILGTRILAHPHVDEQPFTRSLNDVDIPASVSDVEIAARDSVVGFCGAVVMVTIPGR